MTNQQPNICSCFKEIDQMINEGLGGGMINPKYTEAHLKLKEKQERLYSVEQQDKSKS